MAKAVVNAAQDKGLIHEEFHSKVEYIVAHGISSKINDQKVVVGSYHFVFEDEESQIPEGMEEKVLQAMKKVGFDKSNTETTYDYVEKSGETMVEIATMEFSKVEKRCRV